MKRNIVLHRAVMMTSSIDTPQPAPHVRPYPDLMAIATVTNSTATLTLEQLAIVRQNLFECLETGTHPCGAIYGKITVEVSRNFRDRGHDVRFTWSYGNGSGSSSAFPTRIEYQDSCDDVDSKPFGYVTVPMHSFSLSHTVTEESLLRAEERDSFFRETAEAVFDIAVGATLYQKGAKTALFMELKARLDCPDYASSTHISASPPDFTERLYRMLFNSYGRLQL